MSQSEAVVTDNKPHKLDIEEGKTIYWCRCGRSKNPKGLCDGSHRGTDFTPLAFKPKETKEAHICMCKRTKNPPFCDGSHAKLKAKDFDIEDMGKPSTLSDDDNEEVTATKEEPTLPAIRELARGPLSSQHGESVSMGVPLYTLPQWDDIQLLPGQLSKRPLMDDAPVSTQLVIGPKAKRPLKMDRPIFVSDMSFGALSEEAKVALAKGAEMAGVGICSGEGGMLPDEQAANSKYLYEYASAHFGWKNEASILSKVQAFHFKLGQGAKTGVGGHLPGSKVTERIAKVRDLPVGEAAVSPAAHPDLVTPDDFARMAEHVRAVSGGIPIGVKMSANDIEADIDFALAIGIDYIILDARGGGTGSAPAIIRDNIGIPGPAAIARARRHLDLRGATDVTLIATGGLRVPAHFVKAMALGADGVAIANSAIQSIGCVAARMCGTNQCPSGVATQDEELRKKLNVPKGARQLNHFLRNSTSLMQVLARACGHGSLSELSTADLTTWKSDMAQLAGIKYSGVSLGATPPPAESSLATAAAIVFAGALVAGAILMRR